MKRILTSLLTALTLAFPSFSAQGFDTTDFESQAVQAHEAVRSSRVLKILREKPTSRIPPEGIRDAWPTVDMEIKQLSDHLIHLKDTSWNLETYGDIESDDGISFGPDLAAGASPFDFQGKTPGAYRLQHSRDLDVTIWKYSDRYETIGYYRKKAGGEYLFMRLTLSVQKDGQWYLLQDGVELWVNPLGLTWEHGQPQSRTIIYGGADRKKFGKTELLILAECVAAMTHVLQKDWPEWP